VPKVIKGGGQGSCGRMRLSNLGSAKVDIAQHGGGGAKGPKSMVRLHLENQGRHLGAKVGDGQ